MSITPLSVQKTATGYTATISREEIEQILTSDSSERISVNGAPVRISRDLLQELMDADK